MLSPDDIVQDGYWNPGIENGIDIPAGVELPPEIDRSGDYDAHFTVYRDGRRRIEWLKRKSGGGEGKPDTVLTTSNDTIPTIASKWKEDEAKPCSSAGNMESTS